MLCREDLSTKVKKTEDAEAEGARLELLHTSAWFSVGNKCGGGAKRFKDLQKFISRNSKICTGTVGGKPRCCSP